MGWPDFPVNPYLFQKIRKLTNSTAQRLTLTHMNVIQLLNINH